MSLRRNKAFGESWPGTLVPAVLFILERTMEVWLHGPEIGQLRLCGLLIDKHLQVEQGAVRTEKQWSQKEEVSCPGFKISCAERAPFFSVIRNFMRNIIIKLYNCSCPIHFKPMTNQNLPPKVPDVSCLPYLLHVSFSIF